MSTWTLRRRLAGAFGVVAALAVAALVLAATSFARLSADQEQVIGRLFEAYASAGGLLQAAIDQETGVRGYGLTGEDRFLEPYQDGVRRQRLDSADLSRSLALEPPLLSQLHELNQRLEDWRARFVLPALAAVRAGGPEALDARRLVEEKRTFDAIRAEHETFRRMILSTRTAALRRLERSTNALRLLGIAVAVGSLVVAVALSVTLRRWVTQPLDRLGTEVALVAGGRFDHRIDITGPPEVTGLGRQVESMRRRVVTEYAAALEARRQVEEAVAQIEEQATALEQSNAELQRSNAELEQFAYVASHDLQEPLRKVASFCQLLERRYKGQLDERADQYIAFAVDGAKRMQNLINDLLAFSRVGRVTSGFVPVDLDRALAQALHALEARLEEADATVTHDPLPTVLGETSLLTQLFQNLVGNAIKFHAQDPPRVHIGVRREGAEWQLSCADNGIGIQPQYADRIFAIFQRLHPKDDYEGTGIGLALCRKIVDYHGGRMWLDVQRSSLGGATFRWTVPVLEAEAADPAPTTASIGRGERRPAMNGDDHE